MNERSPPNRSALNELATRLYAGLFAKYEADFHERHIGTDAALHPQIDFQITYSGTLISLAAVIGVDAGLTRETYLSMVAESFDKAYAEAPKFG